MKRTFILSIICIIFSVMSLSAFNVPVGDYNSPNAVTVTSSKKLNMRLGPVSSANIIKQYEPGTVLWVTDVATYSNGWVQVTDGEYIGFVSTEFISGRNGDYYSFVANPPAQSESTAPSRNYENAFAEFVAVCFVEFFEMPLWAILLICAALIAGEVAVIGWLRDKYKYYQKPTTLYLIIVPVFVVTLFILLMWSTARHLGREGSMVWFLLLMSFFPLLVHACWRLEQNGKVENRYKRTICHDAAIGKTLGIIVWLLAALPMAQSLYNVTDCLLRNTLGIPDKFWAMLLTLAIITALNVGVVFGWLSIVRIFLKTLANFSIMLISTCLFFIILMAELDILNDFNGFLYALALFLMLFSLGIFASFYKLLRKERCANCHNFTGDLSGTTDGGYSTSSSDSWHNISDSSIRSSNIVRNARELRRTYTTMHNWTNHFKCSYCSNTWSIDESETVNSETHAIKRKWDEYY